MPIEIRDMDGGIGNLIVGAGEVTEEEYIDALKKHLTQNRDKFKKYRYSIIDFTKVTEASVSSKAISLIANLCKGAAKVNPDPVVAVVANQELIYGLSRMWEMLCEETKWKIMVFRSRDDGVAWLKERVRDQYGDTDLTMI